MTMNQPLTPSARVVAGASVVVQSDPCQRPNDANAYAIGDLVGNNTVAGNVVPIALKVGDGRGVSMLRARLVKSGVSIANAAFRVHMFASLPTPQAGDNAAFSTNNAADYLGAFEIADMMAFSDGAVGIGAPRQGTINAVLDTAYALIEARGAYVPGAHETFTLTIEAVQD